MEIKGIFPCVHGKNPVAIDQIFLYLKLNLLVLRNDRNELPFG